MIYPKHYKKEPFCFNPCFNGSCKRTSFATPNLAQSLQVSILVLMEVVKELLTKLDIIITRFEVSILVLMEVVKERKETGDASEKTKKSFNPCFNGSCKRT